MVFTLKVTRPKSAAGRAWNAAWDLCNLSALAIIGLRIAGVIHWSWWWVLAPLWGSAVLFVSWLVAVVVLTVAENFRFRR